MEDVYNALKAGGYKSMTIVDCEGTGQYTDQEQEIISDKYPFAESYPVTKLEILIPKEDVSNVVSIIRNSGRTGYPGDGMIVVSPVEDVFKIMTDDEGIRFI